MVHDPEIGGQAALGVEDLGGLPEFLQYMHQVQNERDVQFPVDSNLERTLAVRQTQTSQGSQRVAAIHLLDATGHSVLVAYLPERW